MSNGIVPPCYFVLISIYFNITLIIVDENGHLLRESTYIKKIQNKLGLYPIDRIQLCYTQNHIEYIPECNEVLKFNKLKEKIDILKKQYENHIFQKLVRDELMLISLIF